MSRLTMNLKTIPGTSIVVGSEGAISIREDDKTLRILTAEQARDLANALERSAEHADGKLIGTGV